MILQSFRSEYFASFVTKCNGVKCYFCFTPIAVNQEILLLLQSKLKSRMLWKVFSLDVPVVKKKIGGGKQAERY